MVETSWRRNQWQLIERHPNVAARVMALKIFLVATLDGGTRKAEQMVERILAGEEPSEEEIGRAVGEDAAMLPQEYQIKIREEARKRAALELSQREWEKMSLPHK